MFLNPLSRPGAGNRPFCVDHCYRGQHLLGLPHSGKLYCGYLVLLLRECSYDSGQSQDLAVSEKQSRRVDSALRPVLLAKYYQVVVPFTLVAAARAWVQPSLASDMAMLLRSSVWTAGLPDIFLHVRLDPFLQRLSSMQPCCGVGCLGSTISIYWLSFNVNSPSVSSQ